ncbi:hypothetical protein BRADI_1g34125v3 [Brachypodium distachyon]|uniref:Uncharacterized protein n=1 Tax=Brachypodium distachyon TaxID=15368 RepID=A0A0Q3JZI5_BRADI|nr:hypothetical protein BRADI_1g34125v3 [Brachypodium distachyon]
MEKRTQNNQSALVCRSATTSQERSRYFFHFSTLSKSAIPRAGNSPLTLCFLLVAASRWLLLFVDFFAAFLWFGTEGDGLLCGECHNPKYPIYIAVFRKCHISVPASQYHAT